MLNKHMDFCLVILTINAAFNPAATWADVNKNLKNNMQNRQDTSTSGSANSWQPYISTHTWLPQLSTLSSAISQSATTTTRGPLMKNSSFKLNKDNNENIQHSYVHPNHHTHYGNQDHYQQQQQQHEYNGNYYKNHVNMLKSIPSENTTLYPLTTSSAALKTGTKAFHSNSNIENSFNSHQSPTFIKTLHPQVQIPKDIVSEAQQSQRLQRQGHPLQQKNRNSILSQLHLPHVTDIEHKHQTSHSHHYHTTSLLSDSMHHLQEYPSVNSTQQQKHVSFSSLNPQSNININSDETSMNLKNLTKASQNFKTNQIPNDYEIMNPTNNAHNHNDDYADDNDQQVKGQNELKTTVTTSSHHSNDKYLNLKLTLLKKTLKDNQTLYDNNRRPYGNESDKSIIKNDNDNDTSYTYFNKDKINEVNELKIKNITSYHPVVKSSSTIAAADSADAPPMEKNDRLSVKEIMQSVGEVQGRKAHIAKDVTKYSLISAASSVADKTTHTHSKETPTAIDAQAQRRIWNVFTTPQTTLFSSSADSSTSKSLSGEIVSGRKVKKVKKKLKKFLLPLLLAYKLKFLTLLPLLVSGLVLLVGTTGMAGFFFALFMAVMSLRSSSRNAVVVKKY